MRTLNMVFLFLLMSVTLVAAQRTCHFIVNPKSDDITVYDESNEIVKEYAKGAFIYQGKQLNFNEEGKGIIISDDTDDLGWVHSAAYRKFTLPTGDVYKMKRKFARRALNFKSNGEVRAAATYRMTPKRFFSTWRNSKISVKLTIADADATPFVILSTLAHIQGVKDEEIATNQAFLISLMTDSH
jgi:hypothetical protein